MRDALLATALAAAALLAPAAAHGAAADATVDLHSGGLAAWSPLDVELPTARVSGRPVRVQAAVGPFRVTDTRGPAASGWTLVVVAPSPADALGRPIGPALVAESTSTDVGGQGTVAGAPGPIDQPRAILTAPPGTGTGMTEAHSLLSLVVPATAATGLYTAVLVATIS